jgi:hypothetical protein
MQVKRGQLQASGLQKRTIAPTNYRSTVTLHSVGASMTLGLLRGRQKLCETFEC